jgi:hypothetical protein
VRDVVGGAVVLIVGAVVPVLLARAALSAVMSLMSGKRQVDRSPST